MLGKADRSLLHRYAARHQLELRTAREFVDKVPYRTLLARNGICIGFNLPFDLSRLALRHESARGVSMRGGFTFRLSDDRRFPNVQIKHLNSQTAFIQLAGRGQPIGRGMRRRKLHVPLQRGHFLDVATLAAALLGRPWSLAALTEHLETEHRKVESEDHGQRLTKTYLDYATNDVQATWECFVTLRPMYARHELDLWITKVYSEASIGKGYLDQMGVQRWTDLQPDTPPEVIGRIMSSYFGGRSEVKLRRLPTRVLYCDFLSMYPTVCTLQGLWRFVIAERLGWEENEGTANAARQLLSAVQVDDLRRAGFWGDLAMLVEVEPADDILPVRARYVEDVEGARPSEQPYTIGLNRLSDPTRRFWYTLADCIASKLLTGKAPRIIRAMRFAPIGTQSGLAPVNIAGDSRYRIEPEHDDFYARLIELRSEVKSRRDAARQAGDLAGSERLDAEQEAIKITANATSYGIFVELNVEERAKLAELACYGGEGEPFGTWVRNVETAGRYFHPLLATLITGAARLLLAIAESLATNEGIGWAFCDTDSMALAKPEGMDEAVFRTRARRVQNWFTDLNPYAKKEPLFKIEDHNYRPGTEPSDESLEVLYCYAVSDKRYALYTLDRYRRPVLRKISAHGLGHLRPPYGERAAPAQIPAPAVKLSELGAARWQYDLWYRVVHAALRGDPDRLPLGDIPGMHLPAASRYAATTPTLLGWFAQYNRQRLHEAKVRPFSFMLAFHAGAGTALDEERLPQIVAPYDRDVGRAAAQAFDRDTGEPVAADRLQTYRRALAQYHLHPERKFHGGNWTDRGPTSRRHVTPSVVAFIGKEANRWEEQSYLGADPGAQINYGASPQERKRLLAEVRRRTAAFGATELARAAGVSVPEVSRLRRGRVNAEVDTLLRLLNAAPQVEEFRRQGARREQVALVHLHARHRAARSLRRLSAEIGIDHSLLKRILTRERRLSIANVERIEAAMVNTDRAARTVTRP